VLRQLGCLEIAGVVGILFAPIAGKIADRRGPADLIAAGTFTMLASWLTFAAFGTVAGLVSGVILLDFGEQGALVSNEQVIYALRPEARNRLNTIFMGGTFVGGEIGSAGAVLVWDMAGWYAVCAFGTALVTIALAHAWSCCGLKARMFSHARNAL
jgi:predicted MFS family arabinose efflux permease